MRESASELKPHDEVVHQRLEDSTVLVHLRTNRIYALNTTGTRFWELMAEGHSRQEIRDRLLAEFDVSEDDLDQEIDRLVSELLSEGLATLRAA
jgi:hypothetical protein